MDPTVITIVFLYLGAMLGIGYYASRRIRRNEDFLLAGRRLGPIMMAGTLAATEVGGGSSMGVAEKAYGNWGLSAVWYVLTMTITFVVIAYFAPKLRSSMVKTVPEYFLVRYGPANGLATAIIMIFPLIGLTAVQLTASAVILSVMTGMNYTYSVMIVVFVVTAYSVMGGLWSVTLTDAVQWVLIVLGLLVAIPFTIHYGGGWDAIMAKVPEEKLSVSEGIGWKTIISLTIMYIASFAVGQETVQRFYAARDEATARMGSLLAGGAYLVFAFIPAILGVLAYGLAQNGQLDVTTIETEGNRYVLPVLAAAVLPSWLTGLVFAALISATLSSADSDLLAAGSIFSNDIYSRYLRKEADDREILKTTRLTMVAIAGLSMIVALTNTKSIVAILMFSFTLRAGGAFIPYVIGHYWRRASGAGCLASIFAGSVTVILAERGMITSSGFGPILPGLAASAVTYALFSRLYPSPADPKK